MWGAGTADAQSPWLGATAAPQSASPNATFCQLAPGLRLNFHEPSVTTKFATAGGGVGVDVGVDVGVAVSVGVDVLVGVRVAVADGVGVFVFVGVFVGFFVGVFVAQWNSAAGSPLDVAMLAASASGRSTRGATALSATTTASTKSALRERVCRR